MHSHTRHIWYARSASLVASPRGMPAKSVSSAAKRGAGSGGSRSAAVQKARQSSAVNRPSATPAAGRARTIGVSLGGAAQGWPLLDESKRCSPDTLKVLIESAVVRVQGGRGPCLACLRLPVLPFSSAQAGKQPAEHGK